MTGLEGIRDCEHRPRCGTASVHHVRMQLADERTTARADTPRTWTQALGLSERARVVSMTSRLAVQGASPGRPALSLVPSTRRAPVDSAARWPLGQGWRPRALERWPSRQASRYGLVW